MADDNKPTTGPDGAAESAVEQAAPVKVDEVLKSAKDQFSLEKLLAHDKATLRIIAQHHGVTLAESSREAMAGQIYKAITPRS